MAKVELELLGLTCSGCINKVTEAFITRDDVDQVEVTQHSAHIDGRISTAEAIALIDQLGFEAEEA
ncbi:cation transporter [Marinospirillum sp. MEB164]|uniref:Cation transporter n=1 Tax=Marinospirillum alkalitolerans TaxID=3123374 RepID=A0ABW8PXI2_9GAMM